VNTLNNQRLTENAQKLRREMTREERHLWYDFLKALPFTVNRQKVIGRYIADFYIAQAHLVIELDGQQHGEKDHVLSDQKRDAYMKSHGIRVLRYSNADIRSRFSDVCQDIANYLPEEV